MAVTSARMATARRIQAVILLLLPEQPEPDEQHVGPLVLGQRDVAAAVGEPAAVGGEADQVQARSIHGQVLRNLDPRAQALGPPLDQARSRNLGSLSMTRSEPSCGTARAQRR